MKVAFATTDGKNVNDHFGWAKQFAVYDVNKDGSSFVEIVETPEDKYEEDDKINYKIDSIKGCAIMYCTSIGPTAAAKVIKSKIHPMKVAEEISIEEALNQLVTMINGNPPPWIKRILATEGE